MPSQSDREPAPVPARLGHIPRHQSHAASPDKTGSDIALRASRLKNTGQNRTARNAAAHSPIR